MLMAASETISRWSRPGTSITKTWLRRRPVRSPPSCLTTWCRSWSVCRWPFIKAPASPLRASSTAAAAAASWLGTSTISMSARSAPIAFATAAIVFADPTRMGRIRPCLAAESAPPSDTGSSGATTAVAIGSSPSQADQEPIEMAMVLNDEAGKAIVIELHLARRRQHFGDALGDPVTAAAGDERVEENAGVRRLLADRHGDGEFVAHMGPIDELEISATGTACRRRAGCCRARRTPARRPTSRGDRFGRPVVGREVHRFRLPDAWAKI